MRASRRCVIPTWCYFGSFYGGEKGVESVDRIVDPGAVARRRLFLFVAGDEGQRGCGLVRQLLRHFLLGRNFESTTITTITKTIGDNNTLRSVRKMKWSVWAVCFLRFCYPSISTSLLLWTKSNPITGLDRP